MHAVQPSSTELVNFPHRPLTMAAIGTSPFGKRINVEGIVYEITALYLSSCRSSGPFNSSFMSKANLLLLLLFYPHSTLIHIYTFIEVYVNKCSHNLKSFVLLGTVSNVQYITSSLLHFILPYLFICGWIHQHVCMIRAKTCVVCEYMCFN